MRTEMELMFEDSIWCSDNILLEELNLTEQIIDLVFYMLVVLAHFDQDGCLGSFLSLHHAALVACSLHLLTSFISTQWPDVVHVLLAHPKLLQLCESESYSYLDKVANSPRSMHLAVSVVSEVLDLLKVTLRREPKQHKGYSDRSNPKGHVLLNSMRLVDNLSNDTNFRSLIISNITGDLVRILALPPEEFLSSWCAVDLAESEEDATLVYDPFHAAGAVMVSLQSAGPCFVSTSATIAALPVETNEVVKDQFINKFLDCLAMGDLTPASDNFCGSEAQTTVQICKNLCTLRDHAISLIPKLHKEDVRVLSEFLVQLHGSICPDQPRNGARQEEPIVEYLREMHDKKFKEMFQKHQQIQYWAKSYIDPELSEKEQINAGISINKDIENRPSSQKNLEDSHQLSEEAQSTGGYIPTSKRKLEATTLEECLGLHKRKREVEENDDIKNVAKNLQMVEFQEVDQLKELKIEQASILNEITEVDEDRKEGINSNTRSEAQSAPEIDQKDKILEIGNNDNSMAMDNKSYYLDELLKEAKEEIQNLADGEKEDTGAGVVVQGSEEMDTNTSEERRSRKRTRRNMNDNEITSEEADTNTGEDRQTRKRVRRFMNGKQIGIDTNRIEVRRTRKKPWRIMNDRQVAIIEEALRADPDMQRNRDALESWTEELKKIGPEFKIRQLRKWIYNRKDRIARDARVSHGREARTSDGESMLL